jgi:hypothetical protein
LIRQFSWNQPDHEITIVFNRAFLKKGILDALTDGSMLTFPLQKTAMESRVLGIEPPDA